MVVVFFTVPTPALLAPVAGGFSPERVLAGEGLLAELVDEVESFEGDLRPVDLEGEGKELLPAAGAVVGLLGVVDVEAVGFSLDPCVDLDESDLAPLEGRVGVFVREGELVDETPALDLAVLGLFSLEAEATEVPVTCIRVRELGTPLEVAGRVVVTFFFCL